MAKYDVTHSCGHVAEHQLFGKHTERDRKIAWLETRPCAECWKADQDRQREVASQAAAEKNAAQGLPDLTGSPKQIAWAETIRSNTIERLRAGEGVIREALAAATYSEPAKRELADAVVLLASEVAQHAEAKWWIDHRGAENAVDYPADADDHPISRNARCTAAWFLASIASRGLAPTYSQEVRRDG